MVAMQCTGSMTINTRVTRRSKETPAADKINTSEYFQQIFESPGTPQAKVRKQNIFAYSYPLPYLLFFSPLTCSITQLFMVCPTASEDQLATHHKSCVPPCQPVRLQTILSEGPQSPEPIPTVHSEPASLTWVNHMYCIEVLTMFVDVKHLGSLQTLSTFSLTS